MGRAKKWTTEAVWDAASKHTTNVEFRTDCYGAWDVAYREGYLDEIKDAFFTPYKKKATKWTIEKLYKEALKYKTRSEFASSRAGAYKAAKTQGVLKDICLHMKPLRNTLFSGVRLKTGIYILRNDDKVVYVGKSVSCITRRLNDHYSNEFKVFNNVSVYEINNISDIHIIEMYLIAKYNPVYNMEGNSNSVQSTIEITNIGDIMKNEYTFNLGANYE